MVGDEIMESKAEYDSYYMSKGLLGNMPSTAPTHLRRSHVALLGRLLCAGDSREACRQHLHAARSPCETWVLGQPCCCCSHCCCSC